MSRLAGVSLLPPRFEPDLEAKFQVREIEQGIRYHRIALPLGALLYLSYAAWDRVLSPTTADLVLKIRLVGVLVLALFYLGTYSNFHRRHEQFLGGCLALFFGVNVAWILRVNELGFTTNGVAGILIVLMIFSTAFRLRYTAALFSSVGTVVFTHLMMVQESLAYELVFANDVHLVAGTVVAVVFTWLNEFHSRRTFELEYNLVEQQRRAADLADQVRDANEARIRWLERFAGFLRHELKNQLVGIRTSIELAKLKSPGDEEAPYLGRAQRSADVMQRLLAAATEATSLEAALNTHESAPVDLAALVRERCTDFESDAGARMLPVSASGPVVVRGDEARLIQLLDKLLVNACEHGVSGSAIGVRVAIAGPRAVLEVQNEGDLPPDRSSLFEPFHSQARGASASENLGIGLYVAKLIAESHGGTISAQQLAPGSVLMRVELPRA